MSTHSTLRAVGSSPYRARVVLASSQTLLVDALASLLEPEFEIVAVCGDGRALLDGAEYDAADVVVLDARLPVLNGIEAGARLLARRPSVRLVYFASDRDPTLAVEALDLGASGYVLTTSPASELLNAIRAALGGRRFVTPLVAQRIRAAELAYGPVRRSKRLTARQREVLQLLAEGRLMKEVAAILKITPRTVAYHKYTMMDELQIKTTAELIQYAIKSAVMSA